jgi:NADH-quinone oxidoreductase subunit H
VTVLDWAITALRVLVPVLAILMALPILLWLERRGAGLIQDRPGPNRVGPLGLLQPLADVVKFFMKEDIVPANADRFLYVLAPAIALFSAMTTFAVIPYGATVPIGEREVLLVGADVSIGILYLFALTSLSVYGRRSSPTSSR